MTKRNQIICVLVLVVGASVFAYEYLLPRIARAYPRWAWNSGYGSLQKYAVSNLVKQLTPGMPARKAVEIVGPGSKGWDEAAWTDAAWAELDAAKFGMLYFNARSDSNFGISIIYKGGKVESADIFD